MSIFQWIDDYIHGTIQKRDRPRFEMAMEIGQALQAADEDPDAALELLEQGRHRAEALSELWWVAFCDHWRSQIYLNKRGQQGKALQLALPMLTEMHKPFYRDFPQRICLQEDAIDACREVDPVRYASEIASCRSVMERDIQPGYSCLYCLRLIEVKLATDRQAYEEARQIAEAAIQSAQQESEYFYISQFYAELCGIAYKEGDLENLRHWSRSGEIFFGRMSDEQSNRELLMWNAYAERAIGNAERAEILFRKARKATLDAAVVPHVGYFDAWSAYHEAGAEWEEALAVRDTELEERIGDAPFAECHCRLKRLRLLTAMQAETADEMAKLSTAAMQLQDSDAILAEAKWILAESGS
ncbi:MAG: hypothetical protein OHK0029_28570 [Armatimonadaceae bacterium]